MDTSIESMPPAEPAEPLSKNDASHDTSQGGALAPGEVIGDHFVVVRKLGGGGMGEVYLAENRNVPDKRYAIKVLRREFSDKPMFVTLLHDEARKQSKLEHDNVVGMYDFFDWHGQVCLVQDFVEGKTLETMIVEQPRGLPLKTALPLMTGVLAGLDFAHQHGVLHCDVKPANVIVTPAGRPRVTDFGISREVGPQSAVRGIAGSGTLEYMSPEQITPPYAVDHRTDVFSAGVMFFEMLTGRLPYEALKRPGDTQPPQVLHAAPDIRSVRADVPEPIARIVATALERNRDQRFQGCEDFRQAIQSFVRRGQILRIWLPVFATLVVFSVAGGIWAHRQQQQVEAQARGAAQRNRIAVEQAVRNAAASLNLMCREAAEYVQRKPGLELARGSAMPDLVKKFEQRLAEIDANIDEQGRHYTDAVTRLGQSQEAVVKAAFVSQAASDPEVARRVDALAADQAAARGGHPIGDRATLLGHCGP